MSFGGGSLGYGGGGRLDLEAAPAAAPLSDPFYTARDDAQYRLFEATRRVGAWEAEIQTVSTVRDSRAAVAEGTAIDRELGAIKKALDQLERTVHAVVKIQRAGGARASALQHIDSIELSIRRSFVSDARQEVQRMDCIVQKRLAETQKEWNRGSGGGRCDNRSRGGGGHPAGRGAASAQRGGARSEGGGRTLQARLYQEQQQEEDLETLLDAVNHMGNAARLIGGELDSHNVILGEMDRNATYADMAVGKLNKGVHQILNNGNGCLSLWVIVALTATLIVLILLVIFI